MDVQELLTYVEELVFKTSMFGYDKDEVDIQLDKICDEVEAIVKEKDKQIEALKNGQPFVVPDLSEMASQQEEADDDETAALKQQLTAMKEQLEEAEKRVKEAEKLAAEAEDRAVEAEKKAAAAEGKAAVAETKAAANAERKPVTKDEAYEQYIRNADLLCKQLSEIQTKESSIVEEAQQKAQKILEEAQVPLPSLFFRYFFGVNFSRATFLESMKIRCISIANAFWSSSESDPPAKSSRVWLSISLACA